MTVFEIERRLTLIPTCGTDRRYGPCRGAFTELDSFEMKITLCPICNRGFGGFPSS